MVPQALRAGDDRDLSSTRANETTDQRTGGASGSDVVDADIVVTVRRGHVRHQGNDLRAAIDEIVDRCTYARMIERDDSYAVEIRGERLERGSEYSRVEYIGGDHFDRETAS